MANLTSAFADYLLEKAGGVTEDILARADTCRADYEAVCAAGARKNKAQWAALLKAAPAGNAEIIGCGVKTDGRTAALINGFNAHTLELDDGQRFAMIHLGASVISSLYSARAELGFPDEKLRLGIVMGYEAACRASISMQPSHKQRGYHAAGTCGTIGCAVGCAFALGMDKAALVRALTCAAGSAAGLLEIQEQQSELKPYNVGRAALDGLSAAYMGLTSFETPDDMLGGERGFFASFADAYDAGKLTERTDYYEIERIYVKPYASCRHSHSAVEAAIRLHGEINPDDILSARVDTYRLGVKGHDHTEIHGAASAKLSTPYAVAAALIYGRADITVFEPPLAAAVKLAANVRVCEDAALTKESPLKRAAVVTVTLRGGAQKACRVDYAKGDPENPMSDVELQEKARLLSNYMI
ncbi:MAG: MmgE/PrpD family protein [Clostridia bacterium]|nr:MmgE/PrpD family protein [Clostridia bacterium]